MKKLKREKYFSQLLYWSEESIKRGIYLLAPIKLDIETPNLIKDTMKLLKSKLNLIELDKKLNIINEEEYKTLLQKLTIINTYLHNRNTMISNKRSLNHGLY